MSAPAPPGVLALRVLGLAGTLTLVAAGAGSLVGGFFQQTAQTVRPLAGPVSVLDVDTDDGDVTVLAAPEGSTGTVTTKRRWTVREPTVSTSTVDGRLVLRGSCDDGWDGVVGCGADFTVQVPAGTQVRVVSGDGDVRVEGLAAPVVVRATAGDVRAVDVAGPLDLRTTSGDVTVDEARSAVVAASTSAGDVSVGLTVVPDDVRARTTAGDVRVLLPPGSTGYRVNASTASGDRTVEVPEEGGSTHRVEATTSLGDVTVSTS